MDIIPADVLVIGAGAAGITAAIAASQYGCDVIMVAHGRITRRGSSFSPISKGWGIQAVVGAERTIRNLEEFYDDIIRIGLGRCEPALARILVEESGPCLETLISYGIRFLKDSRGHFVRAKGCFSEHPRAFITEDFRNLKKGFLSALESSSVKTVHARALDLINGDGACRGAYVLSSNGEVSRIDAKATILATGGGAGIFKDHLVDDDATGEGYAMAYRAGAELVNMEFIQFMLGIKQNGTRQFINLAVLDRPRMLYTPEGHDLLEIHIPDPGIRARAVHDRQKHFPFSCRDTSSQVDLAVARARQCGGKVYRGKDEERVSEVTHFAHAFNGGIKINEKAESSLPGLFAAGEVAAGPHGADRMGGSMMTATQVFGRRAGQFAAKRVKRLTSSKSPLDYNKDMIPWGRKIPDRMGRGFFHHMRREIRETVNQCLSILRFAEGLKRSIEILERAESAIEEATSRQSIGPLYYFALRNMITTARLMAEGAFNRQESLGPHFREDIPLKPPF